jgi:hypothetical protein
MIPPEFNVPPPSLDTAINCISKEERKCDKWTKHERNPQTINSKKKRTHQIIKDEKGSL